MVVELLRRILKIFSFLKMNSRFGPETNKSSMRKWGILFIILIFLSLLIPLFVYSLTPTRRVEKRYTLKDINTIEKLLLNANVLTKDATDLREKINKEINALRENLPDKFHKMDFYLKVQPIFSQLSDQYTGIRYGVPEYMPVLPFKARFINGRLFVVESVDENIKEGSRIIRFNNMNEKELYEFLKSLTSADTSSLLEKRMVTRLWHLPFIFRKEKFKVSFENGKTYTIEYVPKSLYIKLSRKKYGKEIDFFYEERNSVGILKIRTFSIYGQDIQDFEDLLDEIADKNLKALIVDLRDCEGGDFRTPLKILKHIVESETSFSRRYILRKTLYCGGMEAQDEMVTDEITYTIKPAKKQFNFEVILLVDETTSNQALDFAYMGKKMNLVKIVGVTPSQPLSHTIMPTGKFLPAVGFYATVPCAKWLSSEKLELDMSLEESDKERLRRYIKLEDAMLEKILDYLK